MEYIIGLDLGTELNIPWKGFATISVDAVKA